MRFYSLLSEDRVLCYDSSYNKYFQLTKKFVAAKILLHRWKQTGDEFPDIITASVGCLDTKLCALQDTISPFA